MDAATETTTVERELAIDAAPETVWELLVDAAQVTRWMGIDATLDPQPGGVYRVEVVPGSHAVGEFVELDPPRRLVFTWGWEPRDGVPDDVPPGSTTVELELVPDGEGTALRLSHRGLPRTSADAHGHGWDHYFERLAVVAGGSDPGVDPWTTSSDRS